MNWYSRNILPRLIDCACSQPDMQSLRQRYVPRATGDVLEIGLGSGLNLPHYQPSVNRVTGVEPHAELSARASQRAHLLAMPVEVIAASGEQLPADDHSYDSLVCTWTLCSIPDAAQAAREMRRVLKPGGRLYFIEHGLSPEPGIQRWQQRLEPFWKVIGGGCHLTRNAPDLLTASGFTLEESHCGYQKGPKVAAWMFHGVAVAP